MLADAQLQQPVALGAAGLRQIDPDAALGIDGDEVVDAGEGDLGVLRRDALGGDFQRRGKALPARGDRRFDLRLVQQLRGVALRAAWLVAGADIGLGGVAVLEVLGDEAFVAGREGSGCRRS